MGPDREWKRYRLAMWKGDLDEAVKLARNHELVLDLRDALELTVLAARRHRPLFDPMAVRWIRKLEERSRNRLRLYEIGWLVEAFGRLREGDDASAEELSRFLATGRCPSTFDVGELREVAPRPHADFGG